MVMDTPVVVDNCYFGVGSTYPEIAIEYAGTRNGIVRDSGVGGGASATNSIKLNTDCVSTLITGNRLNKAVSDAGVATMMVSNNGWDLVFNDAATLSGAAPYANAGVYMKLPGGTVTNLQGCADGQVLILEGLAGTILNSSDNFQLKNGSSYMRLAAGSIIMVRKDKTSGKFVLLNHAPAAPGSLDNAASPYIDDRPVWYMGDACTTQVTSLKCGYDGHIITLVSAHTGVNTTTFKDGTGNMKLNGDFVMGADGTLTGIYKLSNNTFYEISRSAN